MSDIRKIVTLWSFSDKKLGLFGEVHGFILIGEVFGWVHQLVGSTEVDMYKMSAIGHFFHYLIPAFQIPHSILAGPFLPNSAGFRRNVQPQGCNTVRFSTAGCSTIIV